MLVLVLNRKFRIIFPLLRQALKRWQTACHTETEITKNMIDNMFNFNWSLVVYFAILSIFLFFILRYVKRLLILFLKNQEEEYKEHKKIKLLYFSKMFFKGTIMLTAISLLLLAQYLTLEDASEYVKYLIFGFIIFMYSYCFIITYIFIYKTK